MFIIYLNVATIGMVALTMNSHGIIPQNSISKGQDVIFWYLKVSMNQTPMLNSIRKTTICLPGLSPLSVLSLFKTCSEIKLFFCEGSELRHWQTLYGDIQSLLIFVLNLLLQGLNEYSLQNDLCYGKDATSYGSKDPFCVFLLKSHEYDECLEDYLESHRYSKLKLIQICRWIWSGVGRYLRVQPVNS